MEVNLELRIVPTVDAQRIDSVLILSYDVSMQPEKQKPPCLQKLGKILRWRYIKRFFIKKNLKLGFILDIQIFFYTLLRRYKKTHTTPHPVIVSLTSYPARIGTVKYTVFSLLKQSVTPEKIILWLEESQFPEGKNIPPILRKFERDTFEIRFSGTDNIRSYKKLIPALAAFPDKTIVTADDDVYYKKDWLAVLWQSHKANPNDVIAQRCRVVTMNSNAVLPYKQWGEMQKGTLSEYNFFIGVGGVLYPPDSLYEDVARQDLFKTLSPTADDIWFYFMVLLNNKKIRIPENAVSGLTEIYRNIKRDQHNEMTLTKVNVGQNKNDEQFAAVLEHYADNPIIQKIFPGAVQKPDGGG